MHGQRFATRSEDEIGPVRTEDELVDADFLHGVGGGSLLVSLQA